MKKLNRTKLEAVLQASEGKFFGVKFEKKDGTLRTMSARFGVRKGLVGGTNTVVKDENAYITAWDANKQGFRTINLETVRELSVMGEKFEVTD